MAYREAVLDSAGHPEVRYHLTQLAMVGDAADTSALVRMLRELWANDVASMMRLSMFSAGVTPLGRALVDSLNANRLGFIILVWLAFPSSRGRWLLFSARCCTSHCIDIHAVSLSRRWSFPCA
ncbi:MAG: hypothetical protein ABIT20_13920 [Gemmatimonadaceae bacterium]